MANRQAAFFQSDITKVLKAYKDVGLPTPQIVIEPDRITVSPVTESSEKSALNPWDQ